MTASSRRVFLHVGCPKTGTTYLQSTFWRSRDALSAQGLHLPLRGQPDHFFLSLAVRESLDPASEGPEAFDVLDRLAADVRDSSAPTTLITHETLCQASKEQAGRLHELFADFEVHLVITARDLARQIPAEWQQMIKSRRTITYEDFLVSVIEGGSRTAYFWRAQDPADIADRWRQDLPPDRIHVVTVPPSGSDPDVLLDRFASVLGVDAATLTPERERVNVTLGVAQTELLRRVNVALGERLPVVRAGYSRVAKVHLADQVLAAQEGERLQMPARLSPWCRERCRGHRVPPTGGRLRRCRRPRRPSPRGIHRGRGLRQRRRARHFGGCGGGAGRDAGSASP